MIMATKIRYDWADFMRGLMMFMVVLYHSEVYYGNGHSWSWTFEPVFLSGFFFVSGYLFTRDITCLSIKEKSKHVFRAIVIPYFIWVLLLALPKILVGHAQPYQLTLDIITLRASWFVITIGVLQLIYSVILKTIPSIINIVISTLVLFLIGYGLVVMYRNSPSLIIDNPWLNSPELPNRLPICINLALVQSPFFAIGIIFRHYERKVMLDDFFSAKYLIFTFFAYSVLYIIIDHTYWKSSMCVGVDAYNNILLICLWSIIGIWTIMCLSKLIQYCRPINYIGKHSILFYFLNGGVLTIVSAIAKNVPFMNPENYGWQIVVAIIATAVMFPCVWFINKYIPVIAGNKNSFNNISKKLGLRINW